MFGEWVQQGENGAERPVAWVRAKDSLTRAVVMASRVEDRGVFKK